jgi:beta-lactamase regulating signal transducer with metallopeptidase domain
MLDLALEASLRSVAAAAAVGLVLVGLRVRSGAARHAAWSAVLVTMLTMPVLVAVVPRVDVPVPFSIASSFDTIAGEVSPYQRQDMPPTQEALGQPSSAVIPGPALDVKVSPARAVIDARVATMAVYGAGALFFFIRIAAGWILARRLVGRAVRVPCDNRALVLETPAIATPMTAGIVSPCVLLPIDWRAWPADKLRAVLAHENAHIARRDSLVTLLARVNRAIFWFHPLAWWLERTLAVAAEHACDETAARQVGHPRRYAAVLVDLAEAVRRRGRRVSWQTLGVDGSGVLGTRIDRLLKGDTMARMSAVQRAAVAVGCSAMLVLAIACRQEVAEQPLRADPGIQKQIDDMNARMERHRAAVAMTAEQAAALERSLDANPDNVEVRESLVIFYDQSGKANWEQKLAGIRKHALWRIAHLPETDLWIPNISKRYDPDGYEQAKKLWLEQTSRPEVTANTLGRAAAFFTAHDKPLAETLLIRAASMEAAGPWTTRLMDLYAQAIAGATNPRYQAVAEDEPQPAFAAEARRKIENTNDPNVLANAGFALRHWAPPGSEASALGRRLLERAVALDPQNVRARTGLADFQNAERWRAIQDRPRAAGAPAAFDDFSDMTAKAVSALPIEDRLFYLPFAAESAYMRAENIDYTARKKPEAEQAQARRRAGEGFARARQYANDAVALARTHEQAARDNDVVYRAETVLGVLALKDGNRTAAVEHMRIAGAAPMSDPPRYASQFGLRSRLAEYLLRAGERASVAEYLEKSAERTPIERDQLLKDAARVREGMMPVSFQYAEARR